MVTTLLLGALIGSILGAAVGYFKFNNALAGAFLLACCGALLAYFFAPGPAEAGAVETPEQFRQALSAKRVVLVDFYADWCGPCRKLAPTIKALAREYKGRAAVVKVNVDQGAALAHAYGIRGIPTVIIFRDGEETERLIGCRPESHYRRALDDALMN